MYSFCFMVVAPDLIQFPAAVGAVYHAGQSGHFAHRCRPASAVPDALYDIEFFLRDNRDRAFPQKPAILTDRSSTAFCICRTCGRVLKLDRAAEVFPPLQNVGNGAWLPSVVVPDGAVIWFLHTDGAHIRRRIHIALLHHNPAKSGKARTRQRRAEKSHVPRQRIFSSMIQWLLSFGSLI